MAYRLIIKFPFQSVNDEQYILAIHTQREGAMTNALSALDADTECFKHIEDRVDGKFYVYEYEGTLCGSVKAEDDDRKDLFEPLCTSKLKFAIACQQFPTWLMALCDQAQSVKVVLYAVTDYETNPLRERWRGYLVANTLNMTVVDNLMACPLTAVDELGVAKYMPFRANMTPRYPTYALYIVIKRYWQMQWAQFEQVYTDLGLPTNQAALYWHRNLKLHMESGSDKTEILWNVFINLERYYLDEDATWRNILEDICQYLGVHMEVGGYSTNHSYDNYLMASYDPGLFFTYAYGLHTTDANGTQTLRYATLGNQQKIGADLQVTIDPDKYKGVKVTSSPVRPPKHEYLSDNNVKAIAPASGHDDYVQCRIGRLENSQGQQVKYWRFMYAKIENADEQWTDEADYIKLENCQVSQEGRVVGGSGYFPMTDAALGDNTPQPTSTDSLEFISEKRGMIPVKIGSFDFVNDTWPQDMQNYLMLLNNVWGRKYWDHDDRVVTDTSTPFKVATIYPFGKDASMLTSDKAFLAIDFDAMILNENIGKKAKIFEYDDDNPGLGAITDLTGRNSVIFPMTETFHDYASADEDTSGSLDETNTNKVIYTSPFLTCRLRIGNWFYVYDWDDTSRRGWTYYADPEDAPTFKLPINNAETEFWYLTPSALTAHLTIGDYYYSRLQPRSRVVDKKFFVPLEGLSTQAEKLSGRVELEIWWPTPHLNYYESTGFRYYNNILFILLSGINISFTDEAEIAGDDITLIEKVETDPNSTTKEMKELTLELASPKVPGVFNNCLIYNNGSNMVYVREVYEQGGNTPFTPEYYIANAMAQVYNRPATWVELQRPIEARDYGDVANLEFRVSGLTEAAGTFVPVERKFDFTKGRVRWKLQQLTTT